MVTDLRNSIEHNFLT